MLTEIAFLEQVECKDLVTSPVLLTQEAVLLVFSVTPFKIDQNRSKPRRLTD